MTTREHPWTDAFRKHVIQSDGTFVGDFEGLYQAYDDPWGQSVGAGRSPLNWFIADKIAHLSERRVLDLGCGGGHLSELFRVHGRADVLGVDISPSAVARAAAAFPQCRFEVGSIKQVGRFAEHRPTAITMCGLTWLILADFPDLLAELREHFQGAWLFHVLTFYGPGVQKHGTEYFTTQEELLPYFSAMRVEETLAYRTYPNDGGYDSLIIARI